MEDPKPSKLEATLSSPEADQLRTQVRDLVRENNGNEWTIASILYRLWADLRHVERWGHRNWETWVERELGILRRKAQYLRRLHEWFVIEEALPDVLFARVRRLGWTKARVLVGIVTAENANQYLNEIEAKNMTTDEIKMHIATSGKADAGSQGIDEALVEKSAQAMLDDEEKAETTTPRHFALYPEQLESVELAIKRAAELSNSSKRSHNLSLVCLDFLATNNFSIADEEQRLKFLVKFEKLLGYKLIIVDDEAEEVVYGINTLAQLAKASPGGEP